MIKTETKTKESFLFELRGKGFRKMKGHNLTQKVIIGRVLSEGKRILFGTRGGELQFPGCMKKKNLFLEFVWFDFHLVSETSVVTESPEAVRIRRALGTLCI